MTANESDTSPPSEPGLAHREGPATRRIALGTAARMGGDVVAKLASIAFFITLARKLGDDRFGDFIFGLSLAQVLMLVAGVGSEELVGREVARDANKVHTLFSDVYALKSVLLAGLWLVMWVVLLVGGYPLETQAALLLVGAGVAVENNTRTIYAVFAGLERNQLIAATLVIQRGLVAIAGIVALLFGAGLLFVSAVYFAGNSIGQVVARQLLNRRLVRPRAEIDRSRWLGILKASAGFGIVSVGYLVLIRIDSTMLSFLSGGAEDNSQVGFYGAAYRLVEATMFISWGFGGAMLPWLARHQDDGQDQIGRGLGLGVKVLATALVAISVTYVLWAEQIIELLYGTEFAGAVGPMRIIGAMAAIYGLTSFVGAATISRGQPRIFAVPLVWVIAFNVAANFLLIPEYEASGAAFNAVLSGVILLIWVLHRVKKGIADFSVVRALAGPLVAAAAATGVSLLIGLGELLAAPAGALAYGAVIVGLELTLFRDDLSFYRRAMRRG